MAEEGFTTETVLEVLSGYLLLGLGCLCLYCCCWRPLCRRCCPGRGGQDAAVDHVQVDGKDVAVQHLRQRKSLRTAYALWLFSGAFGTHHFYLDRLIHGFLTVWSGNFFMLGWMFDGVLMAAYVRSANHEVAHVSLPDRSFRLLLCKLPCAALLALFTYFFCLFSIPRRLHDLGIVDVERGMAGTEENPYDLLGVQRGTSNEDAMSAYREQMRQLASQTPCDEQCDAKRKELEKVRDFLDGTAWRKEEAEAEGERSEPGESAWLDWSDFVSAEWKGLANDARGLFGMERKEPEKTRRRFRTKGRKSPKDRAGSPAPPSSGEGKRRKGQRRRGSQGRGSHEDL